MFIITIAPTTKAMNGTATATIKNDPNMRSRIPMIASAVNMPNASFSVACWRRRIRINVRVSPLGKGEPSDALTYTGVSVEKYHIPPTRHYMDLMIQGIYTHGLSMMWISYLQSFSTQPGRSSKPPSAGDAAARL